MTTAAGAELPVVTVDRLSRSTLSFFACASGDHNPIHIDLDVARSWGADDVFAQGMLSMALMGRVLTMWVAQERIKSFAARFTAVTPVNAHVTCTGVVARLDGDLATIKMRAALADGTITLLGEAEVDMDGLLTGDRG